MLNKLELPKVDLVSWGAGNGPLSDHEYVFGLYLLHRQAAHENRGLRLPSEDHSMNNLINIFSEQPLKIFLVDGVEVEVPFERVQAGDTVVIQAGQTIAVDGMIHDGYATIDQRDSFFVPL